ncbi:hypothetical protein C8Q76DRAFT_325850 [Earliella scabrosa]|nr:hypothetical protein C8Q76DRAFT_325850 [Earliella scabrosa]
MRRTRVALSDGTCSLPSYGHLPHCILLTPNAVSAVDPVGSEHLHLSSSGTVRFEPLVIVHAHRALASFPRSRNMAVERFAANQDVVYELCQHFSLLPRPITAFASLTEEGEFEASVNRITLACMARTCKALTVPASEQLWEVLPVGLLPLVKTFSGLKRGEREAFWTYEMETYPEPYYVSPSTQMQTGVGGAMLTYFLAGPLWLRGSSRGMGTLRPPCCPRPMPPLLFHRLDPLLSSLVAALVSHCVRTNRAALLPNLRALHWPASLGDENALQLFGRLCAAESLHGGLAHLHADRVLPRAGLEEIATLRALRTLSLAQIEGSAWLQLGALPFLADLSVGVVSDFQQGRDALPQGTQEGPRGHL